MIEVKDISYKYPGQKDLVFSDFSLTLEQNKIYGLLGMNGTGKSTLLYLISGLLRAKKGSVRFDGIETCKRTVDTLSEIFIVPEEFDLPAMSLKEYVELNSPFYPMFDGDVLEECLSDFELTSDVKLDALSMGQKKKVLIAASLLTPAHLYIWDEPLNYIDVFSRMQIEKLLMHYAPTMLLVEHDVKFKEALATKLVKM